MLAIETSKSMRFNKRIISVIVGICIMCTSTISYAKYIFEISLKAADLTIDRIAPILQIEYSTRDYVNESVQVKINSNELIKEVDGWQLLEDGKTLVKTYFENVQEKIEISDLSGNKNYAEIEINNIDKNSPQAEIIKIINTNTGYEKYANKTHEITVQIKIYDEQKIENNLNDFIILVGTKDRGYTKETKIIEEKENYIIYQIQLTNIIMEGELTFKIPENSFKDSFGNQSVEILLNSGITIDNNAPIVAFVQNIFNNGKIIANINSNETLRPVEGWDNERGVISKEFISDVKYERIVKDLAGNESIVVIDVQGSSFLGLECLVHISEIGLCFTDNYLIGKMQEGNKNNIIESIIFRTNENVEKDFFKVDAFVNTYWGPGVYSISTGFNMKYTHGYTGYKTMENSELVTFLDKEYLYLGGEGANFWGSTDIEGNNQIPPEIALQYKHGVSAIKMDLKEHTQYSIVYQIFYDDTGWLEACSDGQEAMRDYNQPLEAIRFAVVPISEKQYVLNKWNEDIGTYNIN